VPVAVAAEDLAAAVDALLGNVFAHTPDGTGFAVTLTDRAELTIADQGPGAPSDVVARGASGGGSTGLGLDIARRAARELRLSTGPDGGAVVTMALLTSP
jgi:signal transduction histidine kinase